MAPNPLPRSVPGAPPPEGNVRPPGPAVSIAILLAGFLFASCFGPRPLPGERLFPKDFLARRKDQDSLIAAGKTHEALERARKLAAKDPSPLDLVLEARVSENPERALALFDEALEKDPDCAWARYGLAFTVLKENVLDRYEEAAEQLRWLVERGFVHERNPDLRTRRLLIEDLHRLGRYREEAAQLEALLERCSWDLEARYNLAWLLCIKLKDPGGALEELDRLLSVDPESIKARMLKARALVDLGRLDEAVALYETLAALHPDALLDLAILYDQKLDDPRKALDYYRRYRDYSGSNEEKRRWYDLKFMVPNRIDALEAFLGESP